jgi:predicted acetyltransferase
MPLAMSLQVIPASSVERELIEGMMGPYLADLGGVGPYPHLERYWQEPARYPYLLRHQEQIVGFALVRKLSEEPSFELVEFYVAAPFRERGLGRRAAQALFNIHAGVWSVGVRRDNVLGQRFWVSALASIPSVTVTNLPERTIYKFSPLLREANLALNPDASPAALTRRPLGAG